MDTTDVRTTTSAAEAAAWIESGTRFDAILCDIMMPDMDGIQLYEALMKSAPEQAERMVFLSGGVFTQRARAFLNDVPNAVLEKPFDLSSLEELVNAVVATGKSFRPN